MEVAETISTENIVEETPAVEESRVIESSNDQESSNNETQNEASKLNYWDAATWGLEGVSEDVLNKVNATLKEAQGYSDKVINKKLEELKGKKTFDSAEQALQDEEVVSLLKTRIQEAEKQRAETAKNKDNHVYHLNNWDKLQRSDQESFLNNLSDEQKVNFATAVKAQRAEAEKTQLEQKVQNEELERSLNEKYPDYKEYSPQIDSFIQDLRKSGKNILRELAYAHLSREAYGKSQYEKGLNEVNQKQESINTLNGLTSSSDESIDDLDAWKRALKKAGVSSIEELDD